MSAEQRVREIIAEQLGINEDEIQPNYTFMGDLGADSLDLVELILALEEEFEMEISDSDAEKLHTVKDLITFIGPRTQ